MRHRRGQVGSVGSTEGSGKAHRWPDGSLGGSDVQGGGTTRTARHALSRHMVTFWASSRPPPHAATAHYAGASDRCRERSPCSSRHARFAIRIKSVLHCRNSYVPPDQQQMPTAFACEQELCAACRHLTPGAPHRAVRPGQLVKTVHHSASTTQPVGSAATIIRSASPELRPQDWLSCRTSK